MVPIYSLGFGQDADFHLINRISAETEGFSKQIYEGSDAALQLENFFAQISSPLLANLKFDYVGGLVDNSTISKRRLHSMFKGGEFVVAGKLLDVPVSENDIIEVVDDNGAPLTLSGFYFHGYTSFDLLEILAKFG